MTRLFTDVSLETTDCCSCAVTFAMPTSLANRRRDDHGTFYCPNGHGQHFTAKSEAEKLQDRLDRLGSQLVHERDQRGAAERSAAAARGQATKARNEVQRLKRRTTNGVCPVPECHRHFANVERHVARMHPDRVAALAATS